MKLTIQEAIDQGYKYAGYRDKNEQTIISIKKVFQSHFDAADDTSGPLVLCNIKPLHYTVDAETIKELVVEHISAQDEMADEDGELETLASGADFQTLADDINLRMASKRFYNLSDIELIP